MSAMSDDLAAHFDQDEFGGPSAVSGRHRALVLVDEALTADPSFSWHVDPSGDTMASRKREDGGYYLGRFAQDEALLWGSEAHASEPALPGSAVPDAHRLIIESHGQAPAPTFCLWWDGERWVGEGSAADVTERVIDPLLSDQAAAEWVEFHHGLPDLAEPLLNLLAVIASGIPMTPHALAPFAASVDELNGLMRRAAELGFEAAP